MAFRFVPRHVAALVSLLLTLGACARATPPAQTASAVVTPAPSTPGLFLYEVRGKQGTSHLLGTIHLGFGFEEVLTPDARRRFDASTRIMTEADVSAASPEQLVQAAILPPGRSLRALVGEARWQELLSRMGAQIPAPLLDRLEPWLPTIMLGLQDLEQALAQMKPGAQTRLMDVELMKKASELGKGVTYFETVEDQIAIFDSIGLDEQVRELGHSLERESRDQARALLASFASGDEQALTRALFEDATSEDERGFYDRVLFARNERWLPIIEREVERGGAFIAVGAAHLLGTRGLLSALRQRGFVVQRVGAP